jgi:hypothetical protein
LGTAIPECEEEGFEGSEMLLPVPELFAVTPELMLALVLMLLALPVLMDRAKPLVAGGSTGPDKGSTGIGIGTDIGMGMGIGIGIGMGMGIGIDIDIGIAKGACAAIGIADAEDAAAPELAACCGLNRCAFCKSKASAELGVSGLRPIPIGKTEPADCGGRNESGGNNRVCGGGGTCRRAGVGAPAPALLALKAGEFITAIGGAGAVVVTAARPVVGMEPLDSGLYREAVSSSPLSSITAAPAPPPPEAVEAAEEEAADAEEA